MPTAQHPFAKTLWFSVILAAVALLAPPASAEKLVYHEIKTGPDGRIAPWFSPEPGIAYDHNLRLVWQFWKDMPDCPNGVKYYYQHQVWKPGEVDPRGLGGDQLNMALSSWALLYAYLGDESIRQNMVEIPDFWLSHGMSSPGAKWRNLPYPYNTDLHSGKYDGDMRAGKGYLQPDKAASFGAELVNLYRITGQRRYLKAAVAIADTLAALVNPGDAEHSPWPYRVHAETGQVHQEEKDGKTYVASYTSNWTNALRLFDELIALKQGKAEDYARARKLTAEWLKHYPLKTNNWGPFFEDIPTSNPSNTEINADTMAMYILEHPNWDPDWKQQAKGILDWSCKEFANAKWKEYGVVAINEQTAYRVPGNSHTARHASVELLYCEKTGDQTLKPDAIARLNWATYMVADNGENCYPFDGIWLTDGYGDYVRHYLRAMASFPELAPGDQDHLLRSTSTIQSITYGPKSITYAKFDSGSVERFKLGNGRPSKVEGGTMHWDGVSKVLEIQSTQREVTIRR